ncbi:MAG: SRPBCC family protein [Steroidobacteraceae bacterium]
MWKSETGIDIDVESAHVWTLFTDVAGWPKWNAGVEAIELHGAFADGTTFLMKPPGMDALLSTLTDVHAGESFTDVTVVDATTVRVFHGLQPLGRGRTRVTYRIEVSGPDAEEVGRMASADFGDVLKSLKQMAEDAASATRQASSKRSRRLGCQRMPRCLSSACSSPDTQPNIFGSPSSCCTK